jgi:cell division septation protein DedD
MKIAFYLLLLANVLFYLWETGGSRPKSNVDQVALRLPDNSETIRLIKELPSIPKKVPTDFDVAASEAVAAKPAAPPPQADDSPPPGVAVVKPLADQVGDAVRCYRYGPFGNEALARVVVDKHMGQYQNVEVVSQDDTVTDGYWVLYPKAENIYAARANRKMLMEKGIQDTWVFDKGELEFAISLGVFKTRDRADVLQQQLRAKDIEVEVRPRVTRAASYWIQWTARDDIGAASGKLPAIEELSVKPCS